MDAVTDSPAAGRDRGHLSVLRRVRILDDEVFLSLAGSHLPVLDAVMPRLTRAADHSVLWFAVAAGITVNGDRRAVRGAWRGLAAIGAASLLANQVGKRVFPRTRPVIDHVPHHRRSPRIPTSTSFPSGHSASAAAFATAVALERPGLGPVLLPLAAAVGFSRVYTGVHHPSDVVAGLLLGTAVAAVGATVRPVTTRHRGRVVSGEWVRPAPRPRGEGVVLVVNPPAGGGTAARTARVLSAEFPEMRVVSIRDGEDVTDAVRTATAGAGVIGVCGGDGTVNAAAHVAVETDRPLLVVPGGTFNHFAADLEIHSAGHAAAALRAGTAARIDVGTVEAGDGVVGLFLNTASIGAYPDFVRTRERLADRLGGPVAAAVAVARVWRGTRPVGVTVDGRAIRLAALFVGNGRYSPSHDAPQWRARIDDGLLDLRYIDAGSWPELLGLVTRIVTGRIGASSRYVERRTGSFRVEVHDGTARLTCDGEVRAAASSLRFGVRPGALTVYARPAGPSGDGPV